MTSFLSEFQTKIFYVFSLSRSYSMRDHCQKIWSWLHITKFLDSKSYILTHLNIEIMVFRDVKTVR